MKRPIRRNYLRVRYNCTPYGVRFCIKCVSSGLLHQDSEKTVPLLTISAERSACFHNNEVSLRNYSHFAEFSVLSKDRKFVIENKQTEPGERDGRIRIL